MAKRKSFEELEADRLGDPSQAVGAPAPDMDFSVDETAAMQARPTDTLFTAGRTSPGRFKDYIDSTARSDLDYQPAPAQPAAVQAKPLSVSKGQANEQDIPTGSEGTPWWAQALRTAPRAITAALMAKRAKSQAGVDAIGSITQTNQSIADQAFASRDQAENRSAAIRRQLLKQRQDRDAAAAKAATDTARFERNASRQDEFLKLQQEANARQATAADPDSAPNVRKRELEIEGEGRKLTNAQKLAEYRSKLPRQPSIVIGGGGGGYSGVSAAVPDADIHKALADQFGGEDKVPPALKARAKIANAIKNSKKKAEAQQALLKDAGTDERVRTGQDRTADRMETSADLKERNAYMKASEDWDTLGMDLDRTDKALRSAGIDPDNYKGEDIPGRGPIENFLPDAVVSAYSDEGAAIRSTDLSLLAGRVYALSGKAINEEEFKRLRAIMAHQGGWGEKEYIDTFNYLKKLAKSKAERATRAYPDAAAQVDERAPTPAQVPASIQSGGVITVRDPKSGQTRRVKDSPLLQERIKSGALQVVQ